MKKFLLIAAILWVTGLCFFALKAEAAQLDLSVSSSDGGEGEDLTDDNYNSTETFEGGTALTLKASEPIRSLYIKWDSVPTASTVKDGTADVAIGQNGFLHEYVELSGSSNEVTLNIPKEGASIADIFAFSEGELPDFVQKWEPPYDKADILFISTHSDDEVLFFGGMIPIYTNEERARVQVAYFTDFFLTESYRNHELLDGIWTMGVDHYPQLGKFYDNYSESLEEAEEQFNHDECLDYIVETIRRFKPQVVVSHDSEGEYGHGGHRYVSKLVREAVEITGDASKNSASAQEYGEWDVPKTYLHLYPEGAIETDTRAPLSDFGGKNALEVAKEAYKKHESQQWMWFYVDDGYDENGQPNDYQYSCAKYGLFRTTVGADTGKNDVLENIVPYDSQAAPPAPEEESVSEPESETGAAPEQPAQPETKKGSGTIVVIILVLAAVIIIVFVIFFAIRRNRQKQEELARRERARRALAARRARSQTAEQGRSRKAPAQQSRPPRSAPSQQGRTPRNASNRQSTPSRTSQQAPRRPQGGTNRNRNGNGRNR